MSYLSRDDLLARKGHRRYRDVLLPSGGVTRVRTLTENERTLYEMALLARKPDGSPRKFLLEYARRSLIAAAMVDGEGEPLFSPDEAHLITELDGADMNAVFEAAQQLNGLTKAAVDDLVGKSEPILNGASGIG